MVKCVCVRIGVSAPSLRGLALPGRRLARIAAMADVHGVPVPAVSALRSLKCPAAACEVCGGRVKERMAYRFPPNKKPRAGFAQAKSNIRIEGGYTPLDSGRAPSRPFSSHSLPSPRHTPHRPFPPHPHFLPPHQSSAHPPVGSSAWPRTAFQVAPNGGYPAPAVGRTPTLRARVDGHSARHVRNALPSAFPPLAYPPSPSPRPSPPLPRAHMPSFTSLPLPPCPSSPYLASPSTSLAPCLSECPFAATIMPFPRPPCQVIASIRFLMSFLGPYSSPFLSLALLRPVSLPFPPLTSPSPPSPPLPGLSCPSPRCCAVIAVLRAPAALNVLSACSAHPRGDKKRQPPVSEMGAGMHKMYRGHATYFKRFSAALFTHRPSGSSLGSPQRGVPPKMRAKVGHQLFWSIAASASASDSCTACRHDHCFVIA